MIDSVIRISLGPKTHKDATTYVVFSACLLQVEHHGNHGNHGNHGYHGNHGNTSHT